MTNGPDKSPQEPIRYANIPEQYGMGDAGAAHNAATSDVEPSSLTPVQGAYAPGGIVDGGTTINPNSDSTYDGDVGGEPGPNPPPVWPDAFFKDATDDTVTMPPPRRPWSRRTGDRRTPIRIGAGASSDNPASGDPNDATDSDLEDLSVSEEDRWPRDPGIEGVAIQRNVRPANRYDRLPPDWSKHSKVVYPAAPGTPKERAYPHFLPRPIRRLYNNEDRPEQGSIGRRILGGAALGLAGAVPPIVASVGFELAAPGAPVTRLVAPAVAAAALLLSNNTRRFFTLEHRIGKKELFGDSDRTAAAIVPNHLRNLVSTVKDVARRKGKYENIAQWQRAGLLGTMAVSAVYATTVVAPEVPHAGTAAALYGMGLGADMAARAGRYAWHHPKEAGEKVAKASLYALGGAAMAAVILPAATVANVVAGSHRGYEAVKAHGPVAYKKSRGLITNNTKLKLPRQRRRNGNNGSDNNV